MKQDQDQDQHQDQDQDQDQDVHGNDYDLWPQRLVPLLKMM